MQPGITIATRIDMMSRPWSSDYISNSRDDTARYRPLSEPCAFTDVCLKSEMHRLSSADLRSVELVKQMNTDDCTQRICAVVSSSDDSCITSSSDKTSFVTCSQSLVEAGYCKHISNVCRPPALVLEESHVSSISGVISTVSVDQKCQSNYVTAAAESGLTGSVWHKVKPHTSRSGRCGAMTSNASEQCSIKSEPAPDDAGISNVVSCSQLRLSLQDSNNRNMSSDDVYTAEMQLHVEHRDHSIRSDLCGDCQLGDSVHAVADLLASSQTDNVDTSDSDVEDVCYLLLPSASDKCQMKVGASDSDSSHSETGYDLTDNNFVTAHQLRDDIPDSELIDYSDDGSESLIDSSSCASVKEQMHIFIALFDYDPATMSPNPDAVESELPFSEGQLIKVGYSIISNGIAKFCGQTLTGSLSVGH